MSAKTVVRLDGNSLTRAQLVAVAHGAAVELDPVALKAVARAADFLAAQVAREEPIYGVSTGFGSNADKLLGARPSRDALPGAEASGRPLYAQLQHNLIVTHAVCVGEPFAADVVRAMLCIRINTLLRGHSGIRVQTLQALASMLNAGIVPVVPQLGSVGASGDLAPLSHLAIVLLGGGEAFHEGERMPGGEALRRAGLQPVELSYKEGLALNNGTAQMLATGVLALQRLEDLLDTADLAAAMTIDAFAGRMAAFAPQVHALRPHPGQVQVAAHLRDLLDGSTLADIPYHRCRGSARGRRNPGPRRKRRSTISTSAGTGCRPTSARAAASSTNASARSVAARSTSRRTATRCAASRRSMARCTTRWRRRRACWRSN